MSMCIPPIAVSCAATDDIPTAIAQATIKETAIEQRSTLATTSSLRKKNVTASMRVWAHAAKEWKQMVGLDSENRLLEGISAVANAQLLVAASGL